MDMSYNVIFFLELALIRFIAVMLLTLLLLVMFSYDEKKHPLALAILLFSVSLTGVLSPLFDCLRCLNHTEDSALHHILFNGYDFTPYLREITYSSAGTVVGLLAAACVARFIRKHFG